MSRHVKRAGKGRTLAEEVGQVLSREGTAVGAEELGYDVDGFMQEQYARARRANKKQRKKRAGVSDVVGGSCGEAPAEDQRSSAPTDSDNESSVASAPAEAAAVPASSPTAVEGGSPKKQRRKGGKARKAHSPQDASDCAPGDAADDGMGLDDIEVLVREATARSADAAGGDAVSERVDDGLGSSDTPPEVRLDRLFRLKADNLDADIELKRIFGNVAGDDDNTHGGPARPRQKKSLLVTPDPRWPPVSCPGFEIKRDEQHGSVHYVVESGEALRVSRAVKSSLLSDDANRVHELLHKNFWHPRAAYHCGVMLAVMDRRDEAMLLFKRASHAIASEMRGAFSLLDSHVNRVLPYTHEGSDVIFLNFQQLMHMHIRSGCLRTAFEVCKLIFNMDPRDPCGMIYNLEFLALRRGQPRWLLDVAAAWRDDGSPFALLPFATYGAALAHLRAGDAALALRYAKKGAMDWPELLAHLAPDGDNAPEGLFVKEPSAESAAWSIVRCYGARMKSTWGEPRALALLRKAADHAAANNDALAARVAERDALLGDFGGWVRANAVIGVVDEVMAGRDPERAAMRRMWEASFTHLPIPVQHSILDSLADQDFSVLSAFSPVRLFFETFLPWNTLPSLLAGRIFSKWRDDNPTEASEYDLNMLVHQRIRRR